MEWDKKNIGFAIFIFLIGLTFLLTLYSIYEKRDKIPKVEEKKEEEEIDYTTDKDVLHLFNLFSKLDSSRDAVLLDKSKTLNYDSKIYLAYNDLENYKKIPISCNDIEVEIPNNFTCVNKTYYVDKTTLWEKYIELFDYSEELPNQSYWNLVYDDVNSRFIYFEITNGSYDVQRPKAKLKEAKKENKKLYIKYYLDYSNTFTSNHYNEEITLTFEKNIENNYIFKSREISIK